MSRRHWTHAPAWRAPTTPPPQVSLCTSFPLLGVHVNQRVPGHPVTMIHYADRQPCRHDLLLHLGGGDGGDAVNLCSRSHPLGSPVSHGGGDRSSIRSRFAAFIRPQQEGVLCSDLFFSFSSAGCSCLFLFRVKCIGGKQSSTEVGFLPYVVFFCTTVART
jgi:hypothetical protein